MAHAFRISRAVSFLFMALGLLALGSINAIPAIGADGEKLDLAKVPAKVKEAAAKAVPKTKWTGASKSVEDGTLTYELQGEDAGEHYVSVELTADGKVNEIDLEIAIAKVPSVVTTALKKKLPRFQVATAYEARQEGKVIRYDFEGKRPRDKKEITVSVSANGKEIEIDEG
jgi:hypothetical protein